MISHCYTNPFTLHRAKGVVLLITIVLLVVLATIGYTLTCRVAARRHRYNYIIDYQSARYACDSAVKYALATLEEIHPRLVARPNEPDFSDVFAMSESEYQELLAQAAAEKTSPQKQAVANVNDANFLKSTEVNDVNTPADANEPNSVSICGPYGPPWPLVTAPKQIQIGSATVTIEIEDENAKYPISWMLLDDKDVHREAIAGFETFCEWMALDYQQTKSLKSQLERISKIKPFKLDFKPVTIVQTQKTTQISRTRRGRRTRLSKTTKKTIPPSAHTTNFAKLLHSSLIDTESLAKPTIASQTRKESALKYMGMWGSQKVNINTAPRQVLEAAFVFGGDEVEIADEIIKRRRLKPFDDIEELTKALFRYSDSIKKCEKYITTRSTFFTIKVTAVSGVAEASVVIAIRKNDQNIERIAVISS